MSKDLARPGDLLFYKTTPHSKWTAKLIAIMSLLRSEGTNPDIYSHVSIVSNRSYEQLEARWPSIKISPINWDDSTMDLYRIKGIDTWHRMGMLIAAEKMVGEWYDIAQILSLGLFGLPHSQICTTFVATAAAAAGYNLGAGAGKLVTPSELADDPQLERIQ